MMRFWETVNMISSCNDIKLQGPSKYDKWCMFTRLRGVIECA